MRHCNQKTILWDMEDKGGRELASVLDVQSFFFIKENQTSCPDIMLIIYYWQEIFLFTLTLDSEAILNDPIAMFAD